MAESRRASPEQNVSGRFSYEGLERAIHERARLGIMTSLVGHPDGLAFSDLKQLCDLTDGNLNRHLKVLEEEGLVRVKKSSAGRRPLTRCRLTKNGRKRFLEYIEQLEQIVADAAAAEREAADVTTDVKRWAPA